MTKNMILEKINQVLRDVFDNEQTIVDEETIVDDIDGWDSLMHITMIVAIEAEFGIKFEMSDIKQFRSIGTLADAILKAKQ